MTADSSWSGTTERDQGRCSSFADDIQIDRAFAALIPALSRDEQANLERSIRAEGCRHPLIVWAGTNILIDGHNRIAICRRHNIPFQVETREFADRAAAEEYIVEHQLGRRNLSPEAASYLRGKRYLQEKQSHGGNRTKGTATDQHDRLETAQRLAEAYKVGEATIRRDGKFATSVDSIADNCGDEAKHAILARDTGLSRTAVLWVAKMNSSEQKKAIRELLKTGKLPQRPKTRSTITLPTEPHSFAEKLVKSLGAKGSSDVLAVLTKLLAGHGTGRSRLAQDQKHEVPAAKMS